MGNPALENDREVLLVLLNFPPYPVGMIPLRVKADSYERLHHLFFWK